MEGLIEEHTWERGRCEAAAHAVLVIRAKRFPSEAQGWLSSVLLEEGSVGCVSSLKDVMMFGEKLLWSRSEIRRKRWSR